MTKWRDVLSIHPVALAFPRLSEEQFHNVAADIKARGLQVPVVVKRDKTDKMILLDGIGRLDMLEMNGVELIDNNGELRVDYREEALSRSWTGKTHTIYQIVYPKDEAETIALIRSLNEHRRHLTVESREETRAKIEALLKANPTKSNRQVAKEAGVSHSHVGRIRQKAEERGDVEQCSTSTDTKGRKQPRRRSKPASSLAPPINPEAAEQQGAGEPAGMSSTEQQGGSIEAMLRDARLAMAQTTPAEDGDEPQGASELATEPEAASTEPEAASTEPEAASTEPEAASTEPQGAGDPGSDLSTAEAAGNIETKPSATSDAVPKRKSRAEALAERVGHSASAITAALNAAVMVNKEKPKYADQVFEYLLTSEGLIEDLVELARIPKIRALVEKVAAKLGGADDAMAPTEVHKLKMENISLKSEIDELKARIAELEKSSPEGAALSVGSESV